MIFSKRNFVIFIVILVVAAWILLIFLFSNSKNDPSMQNISWNDGNWSIFRGNPQLTGYVNTTIGNDVAIMWTLPLDDTFVSSPIIVNEVIYTASQTGTIYAISIAKRTVLWKKTFEDGFESSPVFRNGFLYIGSLSGIFFKLDSQDGTIIWKKDIETRISGSANFLSSDDKLVFFGCYDSKFYSLDTKDGEIKNTYNVKSYINGAPASNNNVLAFGSCDGNLYLMNGVKGEEEAVYKYGNYIAGSPVIFGKKVTAATYDGVVKSFNMKTNILVWEWEAPTNDGFIASPATDGDTLILGNRDGSVYALNAHVGGFLWEFKTGDAIEASPLIVGDKVFVGSTDGYFYILNLSDGKELKSFALNGIPVSGAVWNSGFVYIVTDSGSVYCLGE